MKIPDSLIQQLAQGRVVPLVGSGVSLAVLPGLFPTWGRLLGRLADRLHVDAKEDAAEIVRRYVKKGQLNKAADEALDELGLERFRDTMQNTFTAKQTADANLALPTALWSLRPKLVVTTNYDCVLQWSNPAARPVTNAQHANLAELFSRSEPDQPLVWHLHGHIDDPDSLILAPRQYERLYRQATDDKHPYAAARLQLRTLIGNHPLLFVGFGLQDEYVMDALATVLEIFGGNLRPSYALLKTGDDRARLLWDKHKIQVIEYAGHGEPLVERIAEMARRMHAAPTDLPSLPAGPPVIPPAYIQWLTDQCADITPFGMAPVRGQSVCLKQVYVPPLTGRHFADEALGDALPTGLTTGKRQRGKGMKSAPQDETAEPTKPQLLLHLLGQRSLYVSGDPGTGKSTFCRWVAWLTATGQMPAFEVASDDDFQEQLPDTLRGRLPVLVRLRELRDYLPPQRSLAADQLQTALQRWLDKTRPGGLCWSDVAPHLAAGSLLLILDGVDEMPLAEGDDAAAWSPREALLTGVASAAADWLRLKNRLLVTSRPYGLEPDQVRLLERAGLAEAPLEPLPESLQDLLAARWFVALPKTSSEGRQVATAMLDQVRQLSGDMAKLLANPLLLTAICIIYGEGKELPQDQHDLYDRIVNTVLHSRYARDVGVIAKVRSRLAAIALGMHSGQPVEPGRQSPAREVHETELDTILGDFIEQNPETESGIRSVVNVREDLLSYSGLLSRSQPQHAAFSHWSFQEFLTAERLMLLCRESEDQLWNAFHCWSALTGWRPTLAFLFGRRVAHPGWQAGRALLEKTLSAIDVQHVAKSLGLALAAVDALAILLDKKLNLQEELLAPFRTICLAAIEQDVEVKSRNELARMLGRVGDPRVVDDLHDSAAWVQVDAGTYHVGDQKLAKELRWRNACLPDAFCFEQPFRLSKYPVTNGRFARFVAAGGYGDQSLWQAAGWRWREENNVREPAAWRDARWNGRTQPVVRVSWWEADAFCRWAGCRLPTEREWEAAARGPQGWAYPWGDDWRQGICNTNEAGLGVTTPVGIFPRSAAVCGAQDMAGNVWEWCGDAFDSGRADDPGTSRVYRGGSWVSRARSCRCACRLCRGPGDRFYDLGFRLALAVSVKEDIRPFS
ncbi:MAG: SUMF1/EgtB/PvdO family nonheme iron enzyme [Planctomycetota bacterium]|nr:SUMF1/EgtB/PvdO family nonheme iron enzyme [Planctomycetota bacterium]